MIPRELINALSIAIDKGESDTIESLIIQIKPAEFETHNRIAILGLLRSNRLFYQLERVASLFLVLNPDNSYLQIQYIRALVEQGKTDSAISLLENINTQSMKQSGEESEYIGLKGRAYKQAFLETGNSKYLSLSLDSYMQGWQLEKGDVKWHGINIVALNHLDPERKNCEEAASIADMIVKDIEGRPTDQVSDWDSATAFEVNIALDRKDKAMHWLNRYLNHNPSAFMLSSTLRQAEEIWGLNKTDEGMAILQPLKTAALEKPGGAITLSHELLNLTPSDTHFEKVWGRQGAVKLRWFETLRKRARATCRVIHRDTGEAWGTGFVFSGHSLNISDKNEVLFATNAHVVSKLPSDEAPLNPADALAEFTMHNGETIKLGKQIWHSPKHKGECDISIYRFNLGTLADHIEVLTPFFRLPAVTADESKRRMIVIGHPAGRDIEISLFDNLLEKVDPPYIRYRSPTEGGSSGSPVFNSALGLVGIHHAAIESEQLNEGIAFKHIKAKIASG